MTDRMDTEALRALVNNATPGPWMAVPHWGEDEQFEIEPLHKDGKLSETGHWASIATEICDPFNEEKATAEANATLMGISKTLAAEVLELRALVGEIAPAMAVMQSEGKAAFDELDLMRKRLHAMHRRAQKAEGRASRVMEILGAGERYFHRKAAQDKMTPMYLPRFFVLEAFRRGDRA